MCATPTVEKSAPELVQPAGPTPGGTLPLSSIDKTAAVRVPVVLVQVFPRAASDVGGGQQDAAVAAMRDGFARALVPYYPVAGRIDAATAVLFKCRALAAGLPDGAEVRLAFAACTRRLLRGVLPSVDGYYGNCVYLAVATRTSRAIREAPLEEVIRLTRAAKEAVAARFADWMRGGGAMDDHYSVALDYGTVTVSDWSRVGFSEVDYGFGEPGYVFSLNDHVRVVPSAIYLRPPAPKRGVRLMLRCVEEPHAAAFADELAKFA